MAFVKFQSVEKVKPVKDRAEREAAVKTAAAFKAPKIKGCCGQPDECGGCDEQ